MSNTAMRNRNRIKIQIAYGVRELDEEHLREVLFLVEERRKQQGLPPVPDREPRFPMVFCSECGAGFGPGDHGFSHCDSHMGIQVNE